MMKGLLRICLFSMALLIANQAIATPITTMDFEEFLGWGDGQPLATYYSGVTFEAAGDGEWVAADVNTWNYDASSWPSGQSWYYGNYWVYDYVCASTGMYGDEGKISFDNQDATFVEMGYSAYAPSHGIALYLEAYDSGGNQLDLDSGLSNLRVQDSNPNGPGTLRVDWDGNNHIAYVLIHDSGNFWVVDNISTDASGVTPEPTTILLLGSGGLALLRRKRGYGA